MSTKTNGLSGNPASVRIRQAHLTEEEFGELLAGSAQSEESNSTAAQAHLVCCDRCTAELGTLRASISLFRHAASAYADKEERRLPPISVAAPGISSVLGPAWLVPAAALFLIALVPMHLSQRRYVLAAPAVSAGVFTDAAQTDEALLDDVDHDIAASVPAPMQVLADPTLISSIGNDNSVQTSAQRKD